MNAVADSLPRRKGALSIRMLGWIAVASMLAVALLGPSAGGVAAAEGAIWTTAITCASPAPQDQNLYATGETVHIRGENFTPGQIYNWTITGNPGGSSTDPGQVVASGTVTADANGNFCVAAYTIPVGDDGEYTVDVPPAKNDNYRVNGTQPTPTPTPTATVPAPTPTPTPTATVPAPTPTPTPTVTVPAPTPTPTGGVEQATGTPGRTPPNTATDISTTGSGSDGWRIPLLGIGLLFGVLLLLTPSRTVRRRR